MSTDSAAFDALMAKVEELGQVYARLVRENAELRAQIPGPRPGTARIAIRSGSNGADAGPAVAGPERRVSRRVLGKALGAAAAGAVGAVALGDLGVQSAAASTGSDITAGTVTTTEAGTTLQYDGGSDLSGVVFLANDTGFSNGAAAFPAALGGWAGSHVAHGIYGYTENDNGNGVVGYYSGATAGGVGVFGQNTSQAGDAFAVHGVISSSNPGGFSAGVRGQNNGTAGLGIGVWGSQNGSGWGVYATSASGIGVNASGGTGTGVNASGRTGVAASGSAIGLSAVGPIAVEADGSGSTGIGVSASVTSTAAAVKAANSGNGAGVQGASKSGRGGSSDGPDRSKHARVIRLGRTQSIHARLAKVSATVRSSLPCPAASIDPPS